MNDLLEQYKKLLVQSLDDDDTPTEAERFRRETMVVWDDMSVLERKDAIKFSLRLSKFMDKTTGKLKHPLDWRYLNHGDATQHAIEANRALGY